MTPSKLSCLLVFKGNWFQDPTWVPKSMDAQVPYIKWLRSTHTVSSPHLYPPNFALKTVHKVWLSGLSAGLWTEKSWVWFSVRACAWVAGQVPSWGRVRGNLLMYLSHIYVSLPLFLSLKINKIFKKESFLFFKYSYLLKKKSA